MQNSNEISLCKSQIRLLNAKSQMSFLYAKTHNKNKLLPIIQDLQPFLKTDKKFGIGTQIGGNKSF